MSGAESTFFGMVPESRHYVAQHLTSVRRVPGSAVVWGDRRRLTFADTTHPAIGRAGSGDGSPATVRRAIELLSVAPLGQGTDLWTVETPSGDLVLPVAPHVETLVPELPDWSYPLDVTAVRLHVHAQRRVVAAYLREGPPVTPRRAAIELLRLLAAVDQASPVARMVLSSLFARQPLALVEGDREFVRALGQGLRPSVAADLDAAFVWNRSLVTGITHVVDVGAPALTRSGVPNRRRGGTDIPTAAVLDAFADGWLDADPEPGSEDGRLAWVPQGSGFWEDEPGTVSGTGSGWTLRALPADGARQVDRIAAVAGRHRLLVETGSQRTLGEELSRTERLTARARGPRLHLPATAASASGGIRWAGTAAAVSRTRAVAIEWLGTGGPVDQPELVERVCSQLVRPGNDLSPLDTLQQELEQLGVADLEGRALGAQAIALLVAEQVLHRVGAGGQDGTVILGDALTAYLAAVAADDPETHGGAWLRINQLVTQYLSGRRPIRVGDYRLMPDLLRHTPAARWQALVENALWLLWTAHHAMDPETPLTVDVEQQLDLLALIRPRQTQRGNARKGYHLVVAAPLPDRWFRLYRPPGSRMSLAATDDLADVVATLLNDPDLTAAKAERLPLPDDVRAVLTRRIDAATARVEDVSALLVVRTASAPDRGLLVNTSTDGSMTVRTGAEETRLKPFGLRRRGATQYCSEELDLSRGPVRVGASEIRVDVPEPPLARDVQVTLPFLPKELFRGRRLQLARISASIETTGLRPCCLIFGARRAGKSCLAYRATQHPLLRAGIWLDLSDTSTGVRDHASWSTDVVASLVRKARSALGIDLDPGTTDLVHCLTALDEALDGGAPVALVLDELDVLFLPEQESEGRRTAARLGNLVCRNLVVIGTVQRFHRAAHEFKTWSAIEVPADLAAEDGIAYFLSPLASAADGPRVEWLDRAAVTPAMFLDGIETRIGLRPYFWAQLRSRLDGHLHGQPGGSRLVDTATVQRCLDAMVVEDAHLNAVFELGHGMTLDELRRQDVFSDGERRVLALFARLGPGEDTIPVSAARTVGGPVAVRELLDRAYLVRRPTGRLATAVPLFQEFLRHRAADLLGGANDTYPPVLPASAPGAGEGPAPAHEPLDDPYAPAHADGSAELPPDPFSGDAGESWAKAVDWLRRQLVLAGGPLSLPAVANALRSEFPNLPATRTGKANSLAKMLQRLAPDLVVRPVPNPGFVHDPANPWSEVSDQLGIDAVAWAPAVDWLREHLLQAGHPVTLTHVHNEMRARFPELSQTWAGTGVSLVKTLRRLAPDLVVRTTPAPGHMCHPAVPWSDPADPASGAEAAAWGPAVDWLRDRLREAGHGLSLAALAKDLPREFPDLPPTQNGTKRSLGKVLRRVAPDLTVVSVPAPGYVEATFAPGPPPAQPAAPVSSAPGAPDEQADPDVWPVVLDWLRAQLAMAPDPLPLSEIFPAVRARHQGLSTRSFTYARFLAEFEQRAPDLAVLRDPPPGHVYDPGDEQALAAIERIRRRWERLNDG